MAAYHHQLDRLTYKNGELTWTAMKDRDTHSQEPPSGRLRREDIVFILPSSDSRYHIYSLSEAEQTTSSSGSEEQATTTTTTGPSSPPPFELSVLSAPTLPDELAKFVLDVNSLSHLGLGGSAPSSSPLPQPLPPSLHVIVSTTSGTCQAQAFYDAVLRPLLGAVGIHEDTTTREAAAKAAAAKDKDKDEPASSSSLPSASRSRYTLTITRSPRTIRDLARSRLRGHETVVLLSGDGGVTDLLNGCDDNRRPEGATGSAGGGGSGGGSGGGVSGGVEPGPVAAPTVALLPLGTGNALFHSLHKPLYEAEGGSDSRTTTGSNTAPATTTTKTLPLVVGLRTLFAGTVAPLPIFRADFSPGSKLASAPGDANDGGGGGGDGGDNDTGREVDHLLGAIVASYGFHASLIWESDTPAYRVHGAKRFGMAAKALLETSHAYCAEVALRRRSPSSREEGGEQEMQSTSQTSTAWHAVSPGSATHIGSEGVETQNTSTSSTTTATPPTAAFNYVLATMVSNLERTFTISPASRPLDGQLRLVHFGDVGGVRVMEIMVAAYADGAHVGMDGVGYDVADEVRVAVRAGQEEARWRKFCVDGTIVEVADGGWMTVRRCEGADRMRVLVDRNVLTSRSGDASSSSAGESVGGDSSRLKG